MINVTNLRNGTIFMYQDKPWKVLNYEHIKMARGGAVIKIKLENILDGVIKDVSFNNGDKVEEADMENKNVQYLYPDGNKLYFMDITDYSQIEMEIEYAQDKKKYLVEGKEYQVTFFEGKPVGLSLPASIFYTVAEAQPAVKGNTATNATKEIILENGLTIHAPQFIKKGDVVKINSETGEYISRGK
jgi:elongation factor P